MRLSGRRPTPSRTRAGVVRAPSAWAHQCSSRRSSRRSFGASRAVTPTTRQGHAAAEDHRRHQPQQFRGDARFERAQFVRRTDEDAVDRRHAAAHVRRAWPAAGSSSASPPKRRRTSPTTAASPPTATDACDSAKPMMHTPKPATADSSRRPGVVFRRPSRQPQPDQDRARRRRRAQDAERFRAVRAGCR